MPDLFIAQDESKERVDRRSIGENQKINLPADKQDLPEQTTEHPQNSEQPSENPSPIDDIEQMNGILPLFASYWQNPRSIFFDTQEPDEHIILFIRKHFITNVPWIFFTVILLLLPPAFLYFLHITNYPISFFPFPIIQAIFIMYYLFVLTNAFVKFLQWYYNISIITNKRIMNIELADIISKKVSATKMSLVQDVSYQQTGAVQSIFNYANVLVQTAGTLENFVIEAAPNPEEVEHVIEDLIGKEEVGVPNNHATA